MHPASILRNRDYTIIRNLIINTEKSNKISIKINWANTCWINFAADLLGDEDLREVWVWGEQPQTVIIDLTLSQALHHWSNIRFYKVLNNPGPKLPFLQINTFKRNIYRVFFFNCSAQISVLKRKTLFNQRGSFAHWEFHGTESLIGCPSFFILVMKIGRNS